MVVHIFGAGITGMNTAHEFAKNGATVHIYEATDTVGGLAGGLTSFGRNLDLGPHIYHSPDEEVKNYLEDKFKGLFFERHHWSKNLKNGRYYDYPISREFIDSLPPETRKKIHEELANVSKESASRAKNFAEYVSAIAGETLRSLFFTDYPEKLWGMPTTDLDANWAPKRVAIKEHRSPFYENQWSAVGIGGSMTIMNRLRELCLNENVNFHFNSRVKRCSIREDYSIDTISLASGQDIPVNVDDLVVNTLSLKMNEKIFGYTTALKYRGVRLCFVGTSNLQPFGDGVDFIYVDQKDISFNRISDQNSFVKNPNKATTVLCCEVTYSASDNIDNLSDKDFEALIIKDLLKLNIINKNELEGTTSRKLPEVYPMYSLNYRDELSRINEYLSRYRNMEMIGSLAEFAYADLQILFMKSNDLANRYTSKTFESNKFGIYKKNTNADDTQTIFNKTVGNSPHSVIIAEIGLNHNGNLDTAKNLIDIALAAGCDAVKLQSFQPEGRSAKKGKTARYVEKVLGIEETDHEMFEKYALTTDEQKELFSYAEERLPIFSAPFDEFSAEVVNKLGVSAFKIASMEITNKRLLTKISEFGKPVILSTGMSTNENIQDALGWLSSKKQLSVSLLHCTSIYPAPAASINLAAIKTLKRTWKKAVGFSDHYPGNIMSFAAYGFGARIFEKHITLSRKMEGPDHVLSLEPEELTTFVSNIRALEKGHGDGIKQPNREELKNEIRFRKTLYAARDILPDTKITENDITLSAPAYGILPKFERVLIGMRSRKLIAKGHPINWEAFE